MEKYAWKAKLKPNMKEEYILRHNEIWPEMVEMLKSAGIENYSIWIWGDELFGYYECSKGIAFASKVQSESDVNKKWNEFMKDVMTVAVDPITGAQPKMEQAFDLK